MNSKMQLILPDKAHWGLGYKEWSPASSCSPWDFEDDEQSGMDLSTEITHPVVTV